MSTTSIGDLTAQLTADHARLKQMLGSFWTAERSSWARLFGEFTEALVRAEVAEEEVVYREVRKALEGGDPLAETRIAEQSETEMLMAQMERFQTSDDKFRTSLEKLQPYCLS